VHFIRQFGVLPFFFSFFFLLAIYSQKEKSKTKSAKNQGLFEIFNSHNKKNCQISIHGSIMIVKKKKILKRNFTFIFFLYPDLAKYFSGWFSLLVHNKIDSTKNKIK
jgi:hypothetical protein